MTSAPKEKGALDQLASDSADLLAEQLKRRLDHGGRRMESRAKQMRPKLSLKDKLKLRTADQLDRRGKAIRKGGSDRVAGGTKGWLEGHRWVAIAGAVAMLALVASRAQTAEDSNAEDSES
jgi:hypothetical protein